MPVQGCFQFSSSLTAQHRIRTEAATADLIRGNRDESWHDDSEGLAVATLTLGSIGVVAPAAPTTGVGSKPCRGPPNRGGRRAAHATAAIIGGIRVPSMGATGNQHFGPTATLGVILRTSDSSSRCCGICRDRRRRVPSRAPAPRTGAGRTQIFVIRHFPYCGESTRGETMGIRKTTVQAVLTGAVVAAGLAVFPSPASAAGGGCIDWSKNRWSIGVCSSDNCRTVFGDVDVNARGSLGSSCYVYFKIVDTANRVRASRQDGCYRGHHSAISAPLQRGLEYRTEAQVVVDGATKVSGYSPNTYI